MKPIQTAERWADEAIGKYGDGAIPWLKRWKVNCSEHPEDLEELDKAIKLVEDYVMHDGAV
jgi:hypothetical protein